VILMPIVYVQEMPRSIQFYRALGLTLRHEGATWSRLTLGDAVLGVHKSDRKPSGHAPVGLAFVSRERLESLVERLRAAGIDQPLEIADEAFGSSITVRDPDGLSIQINEHDSELHDT